MLIESAHATLAGTASFLEVVSKQIAPGMGPHTLFIT